MFKLTAHLLIFRFKFPSNLVSKICFYGDRIQILFLHVLYSQTWVKRPHQTIDTYFWLFRQVVSYCCMKVVLKAHAYFHSAISNHPSIAISMSPEWMVA